MVILAQPFSLLTLPRWAGNTVVDLTKFNLFKAIGIYAQAVA